MGLLLSALFVLAPVLTTPAEKSKSVKAEFAMHQVEENLIYRTNRQRARHGLRPLAVDRRLIRSARRHTAWMTRSQSLQHTSQPVAENIAMGQRDSAEAIRSWMNSPGHRANMLSPSYTHIGVAAFTANDGTIFWCQQFQ